MDELNPEIVEEHLDLSERYRAWLHTLEPSSPSVSGPVLPDDQAAESLLERLGVQPEDRSACLAARPDRVAHPEFWWILSKAHHSLVEGMGQSPAGEGYSGWPDLPASSGAMGRHLYVWVFLAAVPHVRAFHQQRGIPDDVSWASLGSLGQDLTQSVRLHGERGLYATWCLPFTFRGVSYRLGRFVYEFIGDSLNTHIPEGGPLDPATCQASFDRAREFFPRYFPGEPIKTFSCHSWLLDDHLSAYLPSTSNIVAFQRRFELVPEEDSAVPDSGSLDMLEHVFHRRPHRSALAPEKLDELPQDTTLERAFVAHLRAGGQWTTRTGWFTF